MGIMNLLHQEPTLGDFLPEQSSDTHFRHLLRKLKMDSALVFVVPVVSLGRLSFRDSWQEEWSSRSRRSSRRSSSSSRY